MESTVSMQRIGAPTMPLATAMPGLQRGSRVVPAVQGNPGDATATTGRNRWRCAGVLRPEHGGFTTQGGYIADLGGYHVIDIKRFSTRLGPPSCRRAV